MIVAVHEGGAGPLWLNVLVAAQEWGVPPWEIVGGMQAEGERLRWFWRWQKYAEQRAKKIESERR